MGIAIVPTVRTGRTSKPWSSNGAQIIYGPARQHHGRTTAGWYRFRSAWEATRAVMAQMKVYAALHNHAGCTTPA